MKAALAAHPSPAFTIPPGVTIADVDPSNGKRAGAFCPVVVREVFVRGTEPPVCNEHGPADALGSWWRRLRDWLGR